MSIQNNYDHLMRFSEKIKIDGVLKLSTALHIGTQGALDPIESDNPVIKGPDGKPFIPGSSLKGVIRSSMEALLEGLNIKVCHPTEDNYCIPKIDWKKLDRVLNPDATCILCKFMGAPYLASKIKFHDLHLRSSWREDLLQERDGVAIDREYLTVSGKKKYDFETVTAGTEFKLLITIDNPENHELGLLFIILDLMNNGLITLGGKTSRGPGVINIDIKAIQRWDIQNLKKAVKDGVIEPEIIEKEKFILDKKKSFADWANQQKKEVK